MAHRKVHSREKMTRVFLLVIAIYLDCVWSMEGNVTTEEAETTPSLSGTASEADARTENPTSSRHASTNTEDTLPSTERTSPSGEHDVKSSPFGNTSISTSILTTEHPTDASPQYGEIHWLLFTGWQMPLFMVCVEIFAYCVTIFIVFGFSQKRSRVKRFGHFSWKGPNPFQVQDAKNVKAAREHYIGTDFKEGRFKAKKPSIRGHRP
ncbi:uncharacterized protein LOC110979895 [Acanthaster planci]|uniref:Uncharacterized protein LOC110979895 n=1 Tax=Acanthaster planci TaxID=133434 RepID=A0A8B7YGM8_ACAPL|nr:uncharacterized protein LOC110979895 [Acanthaster planci]